MRTALPAFCFLSMSLFAASASGHEFWLDATDSTVAPGSTVQLDARVGQSFSGSSFPFNDKSMVSNEAVLGGTAVPLTSRLGDRPALQYSLPADQEGLFVVTHQTTSSRLTYANWPKFEGFVEEKDLTGTLDDHLARNLPLSGFAEIYSRHAKSLIAVGDTTGSADSEIGLLTEIVALDNPYAEDFDGTLAVQVLYRGKARTDVQVELFSKDAEGTVEKQRFRTDAKGQASLPLLGGHQYMVDSVVMRALPEDPSDPSAPVWESLWASLTFDLRVE